MIKIPYIKVEHNDKEYFFEIKDGFIDADGLVDIHVLYMHNEDNETCTDIEDEEVIKFITDIFMNDDQHENLCTDYIERMKP